MYDIKLSEAAKNDMIDSSAWYDEQLAGLGQQFQKEVFSTLNHLKQNPLLYSIRFAGKFHFAKTHRFPFLIVYEIDNNTIVVNAIFHTSRNPAKF